MDFRILIANRDPGVSLQITHSVSPLAFTIAFFLLSALRPWLVIEMPGWRGQRLGHHPIPTAAEYCRPLCLLLSRGMSSPAEWLPLLGASLWPCAVRCWAGDEKHPDLLKRPDGLTCWPILAAAFRTSLANSGNFRETRSRLLSRILSKELPYLLSLSSS